MLQLSCYYSVFYVKLYDNKQKTYYYQCFAVLLCGLDTRQQVIAIRYAVPLYALLCCVVIYNYPTPTPPLPLPCVGTRSREGGVGYKHQAPSQSAPYRLNIKENLLP